MLAKEVQKQGKKIFLMRKDIKNEHIINSPDKKLEIKSRKESEKRYKLNLTNTGGKKTVVENWDVYCTVLGMAQQRKKRTSAYGRGKTLCSCGEQKGSLPRSPCSVM